VLAIPRQATTASSTTCDALTTFAFDSHPRCYTESPSICFLPPSDVLNVVAVIDGKDLLKEGTEHPDPFTRLRPEVRYRVRACTRYAVEEQQRIELFGELLRGLDNSPTEAGFRLLGDLMFQSHWSYTECGLGCEATDRLIELVRNELGSNAKNGRLYGAKITGGGAGGTVAVLGSSEARESFERVVNRYAEQQGAMPYVFEGSSPGADKFGIQIIGVGA